MKPSKLEGQVNDSTVHLIETSMEGEKFRKKLRSSLRVKDFEGQSPRTLRVEKDPSGNRAHFLLATEGSPGKLATFRALRMGLREARVGFPGSVEGEKTSYDGPSLEGEGNECGEKLWSGCQSPWAEIPQCKLRG